MHKLCITHERLLICYANNVHTYLLLKGKQQMEQKNEEEDTFVVENELNAWTHAL